MPGIQVGQLVVYRPGYFATNLCEEGRGLPDRMKKVVHGIATGFEQGEDEVLVVIDAETKENSGSFPMSQVSHDGSGRFVL